MSRVPPEETALAQERREYAERLREEDDLLCSLIGHAERRLLETTDIEDQRFGDADQQALVGEPPQLLLRFAGWSLFALVIGAVEFVALLPTGALLAGTDFWSLLEEPLHVQLTVLGSTTCLLLMGLLPAHVAVAGWLHHGLGPWRKGIGLFVATTWLVFIGILVAEVRKEAQTGADLFVDEGGEVAP